MKLSEYITSLNKLLEENPEASDYLVITSIDDEGNGFSPVHYSPQIGGYDEDGKEFDENLTANSVCVN